MDALCASLVSTTWPTAKSCPVWSSIADPFGRPVFSTDSCASSSSLSNRPQANTSNRSNRAACGPLGRKDAAPKSLSTAWPRPSDDRFNTQLAIRNLECVAANMSAVGARSLVLAGVVHRRDALALYTTEAAFAMHRDRDLGSLEQGKLADFVVIDRSPLGVEPAQIADIRVLETVVGGQSAFHADDSPLALGSSR